MTDPQVTMNLKIVLILLVVALATVLALVCFLLSGSSKWHPCSASSGSDLSAKHDDKSLVFADLSLAELSEVMKYLKENVGVRLQDCTKANPSENCIYSIDLQFPRKQEVLRFLDGGGRRPTREALAVVFFGSHSTPNITEYVVGPLPNPTYHRDITLEKYKKGLPYHSRPVNTKEYILIYRFIRQTQFTKAPRFLKEVLGASSEEDMALMTTAPRGFESGDRSTWFMVCHHTPGSGFFIHPLGLDILINHESQNVSVWSLDKLFYNGKYYDTMEELEETYNAGHLDYVTVPKLPPGQEMGSLKTSTGPAGDLPFHFEPSGPRYSVKNNQVLFQSWSLAFGLKVNTGMRLFDIKFNGERIVYELSMQEAISVYGSNAPAGMMTRYMDGSFGIGRFAFELVKGVDCPYLATYVDTHYFFDDEKPIKNKDSICIFEHNPALPLRRHYSNFYSEYYGGLPSTVLVVRTISTLGNYDYVFDFLFYQNGAIESRIHATGYIASSFYFANGTDYGNRVGEHTLGTIHTHFFSHKADLDVAGRSLCDGFDFYMISRLQDII